MNGLDDYNILIIELSTYDGFDTDSNGNILIESNKDSSYNEFNRIKAYREYLESRYEKAYFEIKRIIDGLLLKSNGLDLVNIFLQSKLDDIQNLTEIIENRNLKIVKDSLMYGLLNETKDELSKELHLLKCYEKEYYEGSLSHLRLVSGEKFPILISLNMFETLVTNIIKEHYQRTLIFKIYNKIQELRKVYQPNQIKEKQIESITPKINSNFQSHLYHENKELLMVKLHELLDNAEGKVVIITIKALESLGFISVPKNRAALYRCMEKEFGYIGKHSGLNDFYANNETKITKAELQQQIKILENL